jgi:DNA-binding response OmpR family regulator
VINVISAKTLIISDDTETAQIWSYILSQKGIEASLVTSSDNDSTGRRPEYAHDLIIIDWNASQMDVVRLTKHMRTEATVPILLLMPREDEARILEAYEAGADEVIIKPISARLFSMKAKAWLRRSWTVPTSMLDSFQVGDLRLDPAQRQLVTNSGTAIKLTSLEFRLLHLLMSHPNQVLESALIIDRVWGAIGEGDTTLLKNVVYRLRRKIEPDPGQPRYIQAMLGEGYIFVAGPTQ